MVSIGNVQLENPVILAPMAGVTDLPYRVICEEMGVALTTTEMVSAKAILYKNRNTEELLRTAQDEVLSKKKHHPVAVQLFGSEPGIMAEIAAQIEDRFDIIDVNMGCPVPKIVRNHEGSDLMNHPELAYRILSEMVKSCHKPVTVKFRKGFRQNENTAAEFAKVVEAAGVAAVTVHGRTREQFYSGKADWNVIREVKESVKIPVFGNGDIFTAEDAKRMMDETGCDGVALARGAKGNPWLIRNCITSLTTGTSSSQHISWSQEDTRGTDDGSVRSLSSERPTVEEIVRMIHHHTDLMLQYKGEFTTVREMRKHVSWYTEGLPNSARLRGEINRAESVEKMLALVDSLLITC